MTPAELVLLVRGGGAEAAQAEARLCELLRGRVRAYGLRHLPSRDLIDDFVQHVLIELLIAARAGRIEDEERVERFALGICRNVRFGALREGAKQRDIAAQSALLIDAMTEPAPDRTDLARLTVCLASLEGRARDVLVYSFKQGLDASEIGSKLSMSPGNVRVVRYRALKVLRDCLTRGEAS